MILFQHIAKTGGTSIRGIIERTFADTPGAAMFDYDITGQIAQTAPPESVSVIYGHFVVGKYGRVAPDAARIAFLRHPVRRVCSHYEFWRRTPQNANRVAPHAEMLAKNMSLVEFANHPAQRHYYELAMSGLPVSAYDYIGITEWFDDSVSRLSDWFGIDACGTQAPVENHYGGGDLAERLSASDAAAIEDAQSANRRIYDEAIERFWG